MVVASDLNEARGVNVMLPLSSTLHVPSFATTSSLSSVPFASTITTDVVSIAFSLAVSLARTSIVTALPTVNTSASATLLGGLAEETSTALSSLSPSSASFAGSGEWLLLNTGSVVNLTRTKELNGSSIAGRVCPVHARTTS